jgi:NAD(P)-dependent dehydrogenase (short-subunit alcohol dehydrogenase family)
LRAKASRLDVTDFAAVDSLIQQTVAANGRLDYLFNNAGIVIAGEAQHYQIEDWNRVIDVNLRGVVNGIQAGYPILRRQGFGHIVNTASIAGLVPMPGLLSYCATKHAVVALSTSLRVEAAVAGVYVSVLCPGAVETAIVGGGKFGKLLQPAPVEVQRKLWEKGRPITPERFAVAALAAIARNRAIIVIPWWWKVLWWINRLSPSLALRLARKQFLSQKKILEESANSL